MEILGWKVRGQADFEAADLRFGDSIESTKSEMRGAISALNRDPLNTP